MLFYELACHPNVFVKSYLIENSVAIKEIFKNVAEKGSIANLNNGLWEDEIVEKIASLDENISKELKLKIQLEKLLKTLKVRKRLIEHQSIKNELDWLKIIYADKEDFAAILNDLTENSSYEAEDLLDSKLWEEISKTSTEYATQDKEYIRAEIAPILQNAQQIDIIDPYFDITQEKYKKPFRIIVEILSSNNLNKMVSLSIHVKNQNNNKPDVIDRENYLEKWKEVFIDNQNTKISFSLYVWRETSDDEIHDRYIIRDESFCAVLPSGIDERKKNKTVWSDIGYHNIDAVLNDFRTESSPFILVALVTEESIKIKFKNELKKMSTQEYHKLKKEQRKNPPKNFSKK